MGKIFGKKDQTPTAPEAIEKLRDTEDMLAKKQVWMSLRRAYFDQDYLKEFLEQKVEKETAFARQNAKTNKRAALAALKRKKRSVFLVWSNKKLNGLRLRFETQLKNIDGTLSTIEMQREALESAANNTEVLKVMGAAAGAMKKAHNNLDVDQIEDMMDDIQEQQETARLISDAISNPVAFSQVTVYFILSSTSAKAFRITMRMIFLKNSKILVRNWRKRNREILMRRCSILAHQSDSPTLLELSQWPRWRLRGQPLNRPGDRN